jgi:hypothetical protein
MALPFYNQSILAVKTNAIVPVDSVSPQIEDSCRLITCFPDIRLKVLRQTVGDVGVAGLSQFRDHVLRQNI